MNVSEPVRRLCLTALMLGFVLLASMPLRSQQIPGYSDDIRYAFDPREIALLPRYCTYAQLFRDNVPGGNDPDQVKRWTSVMGRSFNDIHHYCWGLMYTNRALLLARSQPMQAQLLGSSIREFDYVIQRVPSDFKLLPEILTKKGENLIRLDKGPEGVSDLERVIALKPDYWPPYAAISDYYRKIGDLAKAREWLEEGLSASPDTKALMRRLAELKAPQSKRSTEPPAER